MKALKKKAQKSRKTEMLDPSELDKLKLMNQRWFEVRMAIGDNVVEHQKLVRLMEELARGKASFEQELIAKYGEGSTVNTDTGEVTRPNGKD